MAERPYRPSNSTEAESFMGRWCAGCARDGYGKEGAAYGDDEPLCEILGNAMAGEQPDEWVIDDERGPRCKAFLDDGEPMFDPNAAIRPLL